MRSFVFIVPTDLLGNRLSEIKIRNSFFFVFCFFSTESSECHANKRIAQKRIDVLIVTVILIALLLRLSY